jgi:hypothetical protein
MKFWQAALLSLMLALCVGGLLRIYLPNISSNACFVIAFVITAGAYALVQRKQR